MKYLLIALSLFVVGCDSPDFWEYETRMPGTSKTEDLLAVESMLHSNGYKRVRIKFSDGYFAYRIYATRKEIEVKNDSNNR